MPTKVQKETSLSDLQKALSDAQLAIVADYRGLSVAELTNLRRRVQQAGGDVTIAKNTLVRLVTKDNDQLASLTEHLKGPTALVIGRDDFIGVAKALSDFSKEKRAVQVQIRGGVLNGEAMDAAKISALGNLPSREALLTMIAQLLQSPIAGFARAVKALATKREEAAPAAEAPAAEAPAAEAPAAEAPAAEAAPAEAPEAEAPAADEPTA